MRTLPSLLVAHALLFCSVAALWLPAIGHGVQQAPLGIADSPNGDGSPQPSTSARHFPTSTGDNVICYTPLVCTNHGEQLQLPTSHTTRTISQRYRTTVTKTHEVTRPAVTRFVEVTTTKTVNAWWWDRTSTLIVTVTAAGDNEQLAEGVRPRTRATTSRSHAVETSTVVNTGEAATAATQASDAAVDSHGIAAYLAHLLYSNNAPRVLSAVTCTHQITETHMSRTTTLVVETLPATTVTHTRTRTERRTTNDHATRAVLKTVTVTPHPATTSEAK